LLAVLSFVGVTALVGFAVYQLFLRPLGVRPPAAPASRGDSDRPGERAASPAEGIGRIDSTAGAESVEAGRTSGAAADTVPFVSPDAPPEEGSAYPAATGAGGPASGEGATRPAGLPAPEGERRSADAPADGAGAGTLPAGSPPGAAGRDAWRTASPLPPGALSPEARPAERPSPRSPAPEPPSPETRTATPPPGAAPAPDRPRETPAGDEPRIEPRSTEPAASDRSGAGPGSPEESPSGEGGVREQAPRDQLPPEESSPAVSAAADTSGRGPRAAAPAGHGPGPFSIHLSSFKLEAEARAEVEQLRSQRRLAARALLVTVPGRGSWYRILLGDFATFDEAEKEALALQERGVVPYAHVAGEGGRGTPVPVGAQDQ